MHAELLIVFEYIYMNESSRYIYIFGRKCLLNSAQWSVSWFQLADESVKEEIYIYSF